MAQEIILTDPDTVSSLVLAFVGDSFYELIVRTYAVSMHNSSVERVNKYTKEYTRATAQARIAELLMDELTDKEVHIYKRGRNAKSASAPSSCSISEYRRATGFEALIGYLYLDGQEQRAKELILNGTAKYDEQRK